MIISLKRIVQLFVKKPEKEWRHFSATAKQDKSGHWRYHVYLDGKLAKEEITSSFWFK